MAEENAEIETFAEVPPAALADAAADAAAVDADGTDDVIVEEQASGDQPLVGEAGAEGEQGAGLVGEEEKEKEPEVDPTTLFKIR